jgi:hypothetical protein
LSFAFGDARHDHPDAIGVLRRLPLVIQYKNDHFLFLALASFLQTGRHTNITFYRINGGPEKLIFSDMSVGEI